MNEAQLGAAAAGLIPSHRNPYSEREQRAAQLLIQHNNLENLYMEKQQLLATITDAAKGREIQAEIEQISARGNKIEEEYTKLCQEDLNSGADQNSKDDAMAELGDIGQRQMDLALSDAASLPVHVLSVPVDAMSDNSNVLSGVVNGSSYNIEGSKRLNGRSLGQNLFGSPSSIASQPTPISNRYQATGDIGNVDRTPTNALLLHSVAKVVKLSGEITQAKVQAFHAYITSLQLNNPSIDYRAYIEKPAGFYAIETLLLIAKEQFPQTCKDWGNISQWQEWGYEKFYKALKIAVGEHTPVYQDLLASKLEKLSFAGVDLQIDVSQFTSKYCVPLKIILDEHTKELQDPRAHKRYVDQLEGLLTKGSKATMATRDIWNRMVDRGNGKPKLIPDFLTTFQLAWSDLHAIVRGYKALTSVSNSEKQEHVSVLRQPAKKRKSGPPSTSNFGSGHDAKKTKIHSEHQKPKENSNRCYGCGKSHGMITCAFEKHPNYNREQVPFLESKEGKLWVKVYPDLRSLSKRRDGLKHPNGTETIPYDSFKEKLGYIPSTMDKNRALKNTSGKCECQILCNLNSKYSDSESHPSLIPCRLKSQDGLSRKAAVALLDTGALSGNYISENLARWLKLNKGFSINFRSKLNICSAFTNDCVNGLSALKLNIEFDEPHSFGITFNATVINTPYDIIIGTPTISANNLLEIFQYRYALETPVCEPCQVSTVTPHDTSRWSLLPIDFHHGKQNSESRVISEAISILEQYLVKPKSALLSHESDRYEFEFTSDDIPWENNGTGESDKEILPHIEGNESLKASLTALCQEYSDIFRTKVKPEPAQVTPLNLEVDDNLWYKPCNRNPARPVSQPKREEIKRQIESLLKLNVIRPSQATAWSQVHLVPKLDDSWRFCIDYRKLNQATKSMGWPIPNIPEMLRRIGEHRPSLFGKLDFTSGYHQAPLSETSQAYSAFICWMGLYEWLRVPMGPKGAPAYFQQSMAMEVFPGLLYTDLELYMDDVITWGQDENDFIARLRIIFQRLREKNITVNPAKCVLGCSSIEYTGHVLDQEGISFSRDKIYSVVNFSLPQTQKELKSYIGLVNYFHSHIPNASIILRPLQEMVRNYKPKQSLKWTDEQKEAFQKVSKAINNCPKLFFVDGKSEIILETDASKDGIGAYLYQVMQDGSIRPISFLSKAFSKQQLNWSVPDKEAYAIFYALKKLEYLLRDVHFTLRTDHKNLTYINLENTGKVRRWKMELQEYDFNIEHIVGPSNFVADYLSRLFGDSKPPTEHVATTWEEINIPSDKYDLISKEHNSREGHWGVDKTILRLQKHNYSWDNMRFHVQRFINQCPCCQKMNMLKIPIQTHRFTTSSYDIMELVSIDTMGPFPIDEFGYQYIIVIIDCFSRFVELFPAKDLSAAAAAQCLLQWVGRYGCPAQILSDNGTQFVNNVIDEFLYLLGIEHKTIMPYSHEENAIVERANKEILRHLKNIIFSKNVISNFSIFLPLVQRILNANVHSAIGVSPAQILFGNSVKLDSHLILPNVRNTNTPIPLSEWMAKMLTAQEDIIRIAVQLQQETNTAHNATNLMGNITTYPLNSYVLVDYENNKAPSKLHPNHKGPLRVINISDNGHKYTLQDLVTGENRDYHVTRLRAFEYDPKYTDPRLIANKDSQQFDVGQILEHSGDRYGSKDQLYFKVRWLGLTEREDSWLPWKELRHNTILHAYLRTHKMSSLIPRGDK